MLLKIFISLLSFSWITATEIENNPNNRCGTVSTTGGVTFATREDVEEARRRGREDYSKNPFVPNVCLIMHAVTEVEDTQGNITQVAPDIYLCCRHTAENLQAATHYFQPKNYEGFYAEIFPSTADIQTLEKTITLPHPDKCVDLALIKLVFNNRAIPTHEFLPLADPVEEGERGNGFVISCGEVSIVNAGKIYERERTISIHPFQKKGSTLVSSLKGELSKEDRAKMWILAKSLQTATQTNNRELEEATISAMKEIAQTASFQFPIPDPAAKNQSVKLMSTLAIGTSGSPLVIKQAGQHKLLGMLTKGTFKPESISKESIIFNEENIGNVLHEAVFLDLTTHREWIKKAIARLRA